MGSRKVPTELRSLARSHTNTAIRVLAGIMVQKGSGSPARVAAAVALLDRGWGRPPQNLEVGGPDGANEINIVVRNVMAEIKEGKGKNE